MGSANATAAIAMEILMEQNVIAEPGVILQMLVLAEYRAPAAIITCEDPYQAPRQLVRNFP